MAARKGLWVAAIAALTAGACSYFAFYLVGPEVDNRLGILIAREIRAVKGLHVDSGFLGDLISEKYDGEHWYGYHRDAIFLTIIICEASKESGTNVVLAWEVGREYSPYPAIEKKDLFICPLTREAAEVSPAFLPVGLKVQDLPEYPSYPAAFLYGKAAANWRDGDPEGLPAQNQ